MQSPPAQGISEAQLALQKRRCLFWLGIFVSL
jgi:hypothetical protein